MGAPGPSLQPPHWLGRGRGRGAPGAVPAHSPPLVYTYFFIVFSCSMSFKRAVSKLPMRSSWGMLKAFHGLPSASTEAGSGGRGLAPAAPQPRVGVGSPPGPGVSAAHRAGLGTLGSPPTACSCPITPLVISAGLLALFLFFLLLLLRMYFTGGEGRRGGRVGAGLRRPGPLRLAAPQPALEPAEAVGLTCLTPTPRF